MCSLAISVFAVNFTIVILCGLFTDTAGTGSAYIIISGSTDGNITFWDLTETVEDFMQRSLELSLEILIDCQRRPQTGRGSQGGRWWRSLMKQSSQTNCGTSLVRTEVGKDSDGQCTEKFSVDASSLRSDSANCQTSRSRINSDLSTSQILEVWPFHVLSSVHQSGVNCLHVSERKDGLQSESEMSFCILSGGDDQAVHCLAFSLIRSFHSCSSQPTDCINHRKDGQMSGNVQMLLFSFFFLIPEVLYFANWKPNSHRINLN